MVKIFGSGLAGLIAARMMIDCKPKILEKQEALPNNHSALLRFRSNVVGEACNVPFREVNVIKSVHKPINPVSDAIRYSVKVTGKLQTRSILDLEPVKRWIAPPNLVDILSSTADIEYGVDFLQWSNHLINPAKGPVISTIPLPVMMDMFKWDPLEYVTVPGWTFRGKIKESLSSKINATVYYPGGEPWYRASITDDTLIVEGCGDKHVFAPSAYLDLIDSFGLPSYAIESFSEVKTSRYQKIGELSSKDRESAKRFVMWLTEKHQIYSLGRFATWRPKLLLDDIVQDVRVIRRLIDGDSLYSAKKGN